MSDYISRQAAIDALRAMALPLYKDPTCEDIWERNRTLDNAIDVIRGLPAAEPESLSDAYMKAVWTWLLDYQIKAAELNGRYTPYEVLSWVVNDWRKEYERPD